MKPPKPVKSPGLNGQNTGILNNPNFPGSGKKGPAGAKGVPTGLPAAEDTAAAVDLSDVKFNKIAKKKDFVTVVLEASSGTFDATGNGDVTVTGSGTDTLILFGERSDIEDFFENTAAVTYTGAQDVFGINAATLTLTTVVKGVSTTLGTLQVDITDTPDNLTGTPGDDSLTGDAGINTILGLAGNDYLYGRGGNDSIVGDSGNDTINGGAGADTLEGGDGLDVLQYEGSSNGVVVDLDLFGTGAQVAFGGDATGDVISGFEHVYGSDFGDVILGDGNRNILFGYGGDDVIDAGDGDDVVRGGAGGDVLIGGAGLDWLRYLGSEAGVTVDLNLDGAGFHQVSGGDATGDIASGFENVQGSDFGDVITGDGTANYLVGFDGDDSIDGAGGNDTVIGGAGADTLEGGDGIDLLLYSDSSSGVTVDLTGASTGLGGDAEGDLVSGFENVNGSDFGDVIIGDAERNTILGLDGDDSINGGANNDTIRGGTGADTLEGGDGTDLLHYLGSTSGVTIDLNADVSGFQQASGGEATGDVISGFEHVYASNFDDTLTGDGARNILYSYDGNDTLDGGDGNDVLRGGAGADTFIFKTALGTGNVDRIVDFSVGSDTIQLDSVVFTGLTAGALDATQFHVNATGLAEDAAQRIIYDSATGSLYFDSDGNGVTDGIAFATLTTGLAIDENDFFIV
ncbi:Bifunctional hemolysin/adenylate cyclase precursor [Roseovarius litorisediminis]|uniref:Bifunctional hemolysin/adenylate cyclase n=1 Tax=Roseovarius litorisediminis TaxID=1312363 RepID=A0A1Y5SD62_9RHOB|nr:calcium-binding protein [Roseovarius litorisediminis]SLN37998.1 Bifunctional hemolysin/adenylate cyclase precursor [Roseovarius litorisediminis]